jgi:tetratricopeptide (TPR) repeat protein
MPDLSLALARIGELERAGQLLSEAIVEAQRVGDQRLHARARLALGALRSRVDPESKVADELAEALEIAAVLEPMGDLRALAQAYFEIGMRRFMLGHAAEGEVDLETAAELARRAGDHALALRMLSARFRPLLYGPTPAVAGLAFCDSLLATESTYMGLTAHALQARALLAAMQGEFELSRSAAADALALIDELGLVLSKGVYAGDVGYASLLAGDLDIAESQLRAGEELFARMGETGTRATVVGLLADVLVRRGRDDEAVQYVEEGRAIAAADDFDAQARWRIVLGRVLARRGELTEAEHNAREAIALLEPTDFIDLHADALNVLGDVLARSRRSEEAIAAIEQAISLYEQKGNIVSAEASRLALNELRATRSS